MKDPSTKSNCISNPLTFLPKGAVRNQTEMAQLDGEPLLRCWYEAQTPVPGQQRRERRHPTLHPQQKQLTDPHVQSAGWNTGHMSAQKTTHPSEDISKLDLIIYINSQALFTLLLGAFAMEIWRSSINDLLCAKQRWIFWCDLLDWFEKEWNHRPQV